jgi:hypothetical protein
LTKPASPVAGVAKPATAATKPRPGLVLASLALLLVASAAAVYFLFWGSQESVQPPPGAAASAVNPAADPQLITGAVQNARAVVAQRDTGATAAAQAVLAGQADGPDADRQANLSPLETQAGPAVGPDGVPLITPKAGAPLVNTITPVVAAPAEPAGPPPPGAAFRRLAEDMRVSGVFQGDPPRALIDGKLSRGGDTIDSRLGVVFVSVDAAKKTLLLRDKTGAEINKKY